MLTGTSPASLFRFLLLVPDWNASALQTAVVRSGHCLEASSCNEQLCCQPFDQPKEFTRRDLGLPAALRGKSNDFRHPLY